MQRAWFLGGARASARVGRFMVGLGGALACGQALGAVAVFQNGAPTPIVGGTYTGNTDTMLLTNGGNFFNSSSDNFGERSDMAIGPALVIGENAPRHVVSRFDITALAGQYTVINSVTLRLNITSAPQGTNTAQLFRLTDANAGWAEGVGTSANGYGPEDAGGATWNYKVQAAFPNEFSGTPWAGMTGNFSPQGGAGVAGVDYHSTPLAVNAYTTATSGVMDFVLADISFIPTWINGGTNPGFFMRTLLENNAPSVINYFSSEGATQSLRPQLIIDYTVIPGPGTTALLALGGLGMLRRRMK